MTGKTGDRAIGVGMGGSCPSCRAPIDLGQEFCLECGASVRGDRAKAATARPGAGAGTPPTAAATPQPGAFPWVPFLAVLGLVAAGIVFAFANIGGTEERSGNIPANQTTSNPTFPTVPTTTTGDAEECKAVPSSPATPPPPPPPPSDIAPGLESPASPATPTTPSTATSPTSTDQATGVYTDAEGNLCTPGTSTAPTTPTTPTLTTATGATTATGPTGGGNGGSWPVGRTGFTIVLASLPKAHYSRNDADVRAVEAQQQGVDAGVVDSDQFPSLKPGLWVIYSGVYDTEAQAEASLPGVRAKNYQGAYVRQVSSTPQ